MKVKISLETQIELGEILHSARVQARMTQKELALSIGLTSSQFISNAERGICALSLEAYSKICRVLKMDPSKISKIIKEDHCREIDKVLLPQKSSAKKAA